MVKGWILLGYALYFWYICYTGDLNKYINMKYAYMVYLAIAGFLILAVVQFISHYRNKAHDHACESPDCGHDQHKKTKPLVYFLYLIPLLGGFDLPVATLDSHMVQTKGISFPTMQQGGHWNKWNQILQPDSSAFYGRDDYNAMMAKQLADMKAQQDLMFNDKNYMNNMEVLYKNQSDFVGKEVELDGFVFNDSHLASGHAFLLRFGMVHCILDSGVYGLMVEIPAGATFKNDEWYHIKGTLSQTFYSPIGGPIPSVKIEQFKPIQAPKEPYVYRN
jgi:putative membrane protein